MMHVLRAVFAALLIGLPFANAAEVKLASVFSDHMVLQREVPIRVWGWAEAKHTITVRLGDDEAKAITNADGRWSVELPARKATAVGLKLTVKDTTDATSPEIQKTDILVGEVWLCSGQSNMEWPVSLSSNAAEEIASANDPLIRHLKVPLVPSMVPLQAFDATWQVGSPETVPSFTACGYFMAKKLRKELDVPVGLINSSWGGTRIEPWTPPVGFEQVSALRDIYQSVLGRTPGTDAYQKRLAEHLASIDAWLVRARQGLESKKGIDPNPAFPTELVPFSSNQDPTMLYNGMIHALVGYPIRGAIWYQGESNHGEGMLYTEKMRALIGGWRTLWKQGDFSFYFVQIAPYQYGSEDPTILAKFWEAQAASQSIPHTGMVVINDIATLNDIHPPNKQDVGLRLALLALKHDYGQSNLVAESPELDRVEALGDRLKLYFKNSGGGLKTRDGKPASHFEVIGPESNGYHPAIATLDGPTVTLTSDAVSKPVAFRFAWHMLAEPNLCGGTGLPVGAVRGGKEPEFLDSIRDAKQYTLIYDLDLAKLSHDPHYDVDSSASVKAFDRIAYLLELTSSNGQEQKIFVSMKAFTDDIKKIGIPTLKSQARFQSNIASMDVYSNVNGIVTGKQIETGNIEFWPDNYAMTNQAGVPGASDSIYDFGDGTATPEDGYGSMQIHNHGARQTLLAINHWGAGNGADLGIGNSSGGPQDWTFSGNAHTYTHKRLRIYVRPTK